MSTTGSGAAAVAGSAAALDDTGPEVAADADAALNATPPTTAKAASSPVMAARILVIVMPCFLRTSLG
jgi:hypothetical protein